MKLTQLNYFNAICELGSISKASKALHVSQPSISSAIISLENELGVNLYYRSGKKLILTPEGKVLYSLSTSLTNDANKLINIMKDIGNKKNNIKVGIPPMIGAFLLPSIFNGFKKLYPDINLELFEFGSSDTCKLVEDDSIDIAISILDNVNTSVFNTHKLFSTEIRYFTNKSNPLSSLSSITVDNIGNSPIALFKGGYYHVDAIKELFKKSNLTPNIVLGSSQLHTIKEFVKLNIAGSFLFREIEETDFSIVSIPLNPPINVNVGLVWKKGQYIYDDAKRFIEFIENLKI